MRNAFFIRGTKLDWTLFELQSEILTDGHALFAGEFTSVFASFMLLHLCAWRHREVLAPDTSKRAVLRFETSQNALAAGTGALAMALCASGVGIE